MTIKQIFTRDATIKQILDFVADKDDEVFTLAELIDYLNLDTLAEKDKRRLRREMPAANKYKLQNRRLWFFGSETAIRKMKELDETYRT